MAEPTVTVSISFKTLVKAISALSLKDKNRLLDMLEKQIADEEAEIWLNDPEIRAEIEQAYADYRAGDYITAEE